MDPPEMAIWVHDQILEMLNFHPPQIGGRMDGIYQNGRWREGRNGLFHRHEREQLTLPRVDPAAYKDQNEIASQLTIDA